MLHLKSLFYSVRYPRHLKMRAFGKREKPLNIDIYVIRLNERSQHPRSFIGVAIYPNNLKMRYFKDDIQVQFKEKIYWDHPSLLKMFDATRAC